jgi:signal transduction histidine kinase
MSRRSTVTPLTIGIVLMLLLLSLAAGWQVLVWTDRPDASPSLRPSDWLLLVLGSLFFLVVMVGLLWMCVWLVREMQLNQRQRAFLDAVTHEMRTPLSSFRLYLDTLRHRDPPAPQRERFLDQMREDLDRLEQTVEHVLVAARTEEARGTPFRENVDLLSLIGGCIAEVRERHQLPSEAVCLEAHHESAVRGDAAELSLVFANLLENAVKYSEHPVEVRVAVSELREGRVRVEIADRGIGIPHRELRKIFQRFYRVGRDVQRQVAGLGLGLFVVRSLLRRHGGRIVARSDGAGRGSRFVVTLRAAPRPS